MISEQPPEEEPQLSEPIFCGSQDMLTPFDSEADTWKVERRDGEITPEEATVVEGLLEPLQSAVTVDDMLPPPDDGQPAIVQPVKPGDGPDGGQSPATVGDLSPNNISPEAFDIMLEEIEKYLAEKAKERVG